MNLISILNDYNGILTFISVLVAIYVFNHDKNKKKEAYNKKQKVILKTLELEIKKIKQDLDGHKKNFIIRENSLGFFPIKELNKFYYLHEIDDSKFKRASELKDSIVTINDKVVLFNNYLNYILQDFNQDLLKNVNKMTPKKALFEAIQREVNRIETRPIYYYWTEHAKIVMDDLEKEIEKVLEILCCISN